MAAEGRAGLEEAVRKTAASQRLSSEAMSPRPARVSCPLSGAFPGLSVLLSFISIRQELMIY